MVLVNTSDGMTEGFDLTDANQYEQLLSTLNSGNATSLSLLHNSIQHALPKPRRFGNDYSYGAEPIYSSTGMVGERIYLQARDVRVSLSLTYSSKLIRCDLVRTGKMKYDPRKF